MSSKRQKRSKRPPKKWARQLNKLREIIDMHQWLGMMTLKLPEGLTIDDEDKLVDQICQMLVYRFRAHGLKVSFLMKREFGKKPRRALHYHIIFTSQEIEAIPQETLEKIQKSWLRIVGKSSNQGRYFDWQCPHDGEYLKKWQKGGQDVVSIPPRYADCKLSPHMFHTRGLGPMAGLTEAKTDDSSRSVTCNKSELPSICPVPMENDPYWSEDDSGGVKRLPVRRDRQACDPSAMRDSSLVAPSFFTRNSSVMPDLVFIRSSSEIHTKQNTADGSVFTQNEPTGNCRTCEYEGRYSPKILGLARCPLCDEPWDRCFY